MLFNNLREKKYILGQPTPTELEEICVVNKKLVNKNERKKAS